MKPTCSCWYVYDKFNLILTVSIDHIYRFLCERIVVFREFSYGTGGGGWWEQVSACVGPGVSVHLLRGCSMCVCVYNTGLYLI